jgi:pilus assembly protein CpaE
MKVRIVTPQPANAERWAAALRRAERQFDVLAIVQPLDELRLGAEDVRPDLLIAEAASASELDALEALAHAHPEIDCLLISVALTPDTLMRLMRAGVRDVLPDPTSDEAVVAAAQRLARKRAPAVAATEAPRNGSVIGFVSCKGGGGTTFVAANLAHLLAQGGERRVALLDLNLQFGDAALFVTSEPTASNVAAVARSIQRLDRDLLQSAMTPAGPGLWVLPAPDDPAQAGDVAPEHVQAMLALAVTMFDYVVVDLGRTLSAVTVKALDACQRVYVVLQQTLPFIRDGRRLRDALRALDYPASKVHWIVNRLEKGGEIGLDDIQRTLGVAELITLPNQHDIVAASVNQGVPVGRLAPRSAIARALRELADSVAPPVPASRASRWLSGLWHGAAA